MPLPIRLVEETLARIRQLYDVEDRAKSFTPDERRALRERESRPIVERIFARLDEHRGELRPTSQLKLHHLDVTAYLTDVLRRLPAIPSADESALRELLPDRWAKAHPQNVLQARQQESLAALEQRRLRRTQRRLQTTA